MSTSNDTTAAAAAAGSTPRLFMHVQYKVPCFTDDGGSSSAEEQTQKQAIVTTTKQSFDASNCPNNRTPLGLNTEYADKVPSFLDPKLYSININVDIIKYNAPKS